MSLGQVDSVGGKLEPVKANGYYDTCIPLWSSLPKLHYQCLSILFSNFSNEGQFLFSVDHSNFKCTTNTYGNFYHDTY